MENYLSENEEYEVHAFCKGCNKKFEARVPKKDIDAGNVKCGLCESSNIDIFSSNPVRQILME
jgi:hypothetical protein